MGKKNWLKLQKSNLFLNENKLERREHKESENAYSRSVDAKRCHILIWPCPNIYCTLNYDCLQILCMKLNHSVQCQTVCTIVHKLCSTIYVCIIWVVCYCCYSDCVVFIRIAYVGLAVKCWCFFLLFMLWCSGGRLKTNWKCNSTFAPFVSRF